MDINKNANLSMLCDFYELTMGNGYFVQGMQDRITYFDIFFRSVPDNGGYAIAAGLEQAIEYIQQLHFDEDDIAYLRSRNMFDEGFLSYLRDFRFTGDIWAVPEGTPIFPREPIMTVRAPAIQAQLVETFLLLTLNHQSLIATKANRVVRAAKGRVVLEFGSRRAQGVVQGLNLLRPVHAHQVQDRALLEIIPADIIAIGRTTALLIHVPLRLVAQLPVIDQQHIVLNTVEETVDSLLLKDLAALHGQFLRQQAGVEEGLLPQIKHGGAVHDNYRKPQPQALSRLPHGGRSPHRGHGEQQPIVQHPVQSHPAGGSQGLAAQLHQHAVQAGDKQDVPALAPRKLKGVDTDPHGDTQHGLHHTIPDKDPGVGIGDMRHGNAEKDHAGQRRRVGRLQCHRSP